MKRHSRSRSPPASRIARPPASQKGRHRAGQWSPAGWRGQTEFQVFFRKYQPPTLIVWGKNDYIFPAEGAAPYKRDLTNVETHPLDTGHFALETHGEEIASRIEKFFA